MNTKAFGSYGFLLVGVVGLGAYVAWCFSRSAAILRHWAAESSFEIVDAKIQFFSYGPFDWISSNGQTVYHVQIRDRDRRERSGWVRCGSFWLGVLSKKVEVRWDEELQR